MSRGLEGPRARRERPVRTPRVPPAPPGHPVAQRAVPAPRAAAAPARPADSVYNFVSFQACALPCSRGGSGWRFPPRPEPPGRTPRPPPAPRRREDRGAPARPPPHRVHTLAPGPFCPRGLTRRPGPLRHPFFSVTPPPVPNLLNAPHTPVLGEWPPRQARQLRTPRAGPQGGAEQRTHRPLSFSPL